MNASRMKLSRYTLNATVAAVATSSCFYYGVQGFTSRTAASSSTSAAILRNTAGMLRNRHLPSSLPMILDRFFASFGGGGGGAFGSVIDYDSIPFPVPELATMAKENRVPEDFQETYKVATFAGGCFWGLELAYQRVPGVAYTTVGYTQGKEAFPNYDAVCAGATGHTEAVIVLYDPNECTYESLLDVFFDRVDPLTVNGQGNDRGRQYRTGVYYHSPEQEELARARFQLEQQQQKDKNQQIATECAPAMLFWPAEGYHQQYLENGGRTKAPQSAEKGCKDTIRCYG